MKMKIHKYHFIETSFSQARDKITILIKCASVSFFHFYFLFGLGGGSDQIVFVLIVISEFQVSWRITSVEIYKE